MKFRLYRKLCVFSSMHVFKREEVPVGEACVPGAPPIACHPQLPGEPHQPISGTTRSADLIIKGNQTPCICLSNQNTTSVLRCFVSSSRSNRFNGIFRVAHLAEIKHAHTGAKGYARDIHTRLTTTDMQMLASRVIKGATHALDIPPGVLF